MSKSPQKPQSDPLNPRGANADRKTDAAPAQAIGLPDFVAGSGVLDRLVDTARDYARQATAENTNTAYKQDWKHFASWSRRRGADPLPPNAELIGLYIANCAAPDDRSPSMVAAFDARSF